MRLAIVVTEYPKVTETFIYRDVVELERLGHEVRLYHLTRRRVNEVVHAFAERTSALARSTPYLLGGGVPGAFLGAVLTRPWTLARIVLDVVRGYRRRPRWALKTLAILPKCVAIARELERWGADHLHGEFATHPATCGWIVRRLTGLPYSVSCHAHDIFRTQDMLDLKLGEAAFVRTISRFNRDFLKERVPALAAQTFLVNHVGVDIEAMQPLDAPPTAAFRILYVGSLEPRKGVHFLLRALEIVEQRSGEWSCDVLGDGPMRAELEELCVRLGLAKRVRFHGSQPYEAVSSAMRAASVVVVPSTYDATGRTEGIPTVLIEALAWRRPVVATSVSGISELVADGETGTLVEHADPDALARALEWVRNEPEAAWRMALRGRRKVEAEFDLRRTVAEQVEWFERHRAPANRTA